MIETQAPDAELISRFAKAAHLASGAALRKFEDWYRQGTGTEFCALFEPPMPETLRVDF